VRNVRVIALLAAFACGLLPFAASGQKYPDRPIDLVVPYPAGGNSDVIGRVIGKELSMALGQPVVVENKPGAAATIGTAFVARAKADGYTLLLGDIATHALNKLAMPNLPYDPQKDFVPIARITSVSLFLVVNPKHDVRTVSDFIALAQKQPGKLAYASGGNGTPSHLAMESLRAVTGIDLLHVPYKGSAPALNDLVGGQVDVMIDGAAAPLIKGGKLKLLGVTGPRSPAFPDAPTLAESGVPGYEFVSWHGLFAPAGTPKEIVDRIAAEVQRIVQKPEIRQRFADLGIALVSGPPASFATFIDEQNRKLGALVKERNVKFEQ
jgi:tripartite-type tricarboxylate transporter receptor subunit TctC